MARSDAAQPNLFEPEPPGDSGVAHGAIAHADAGDDHGAPVPYELTGRGRQLVDSDIPDLRVVPDAASSAVPAEPVEATSIGAGGRVPADDEGSLGDELAHVGGALHARVRALRRAGADRVEIGARLGLQPVTVAVFDAPDDLPGPAADGSRVGLGDGDGDGGVSPSTRRSAALAVVATVGHVDRSGMTVTTGRIRSAAVVVQWLRQDVGTPVSAIRVVLRVADQATADIVARAWADRLGLGRDRVSTVAWPRSPGPRDVQAVVRVNGHGLVDDIEAELAAWPARPAAAWPS